MLLGTYRLVTWLVEPLVMVAKRWRGEATYDAGRRPSGPLVWMHGVSVGESLSLLPLIDELGAQRPDISILVTSRTHTAAQILAQRLPPSVVHRNAPVDLPRCVERFLADWDPQLLVLAESELWPNLLLHARRCGVPVVSVNARLSAKSVRNWRRLRGVAQELLQGISSVFAQDEQSARNWREIGADAAKVEVTGSLKSASAPLPAREEELTTLRTALTDRPVWLAASTHEADEALVLEAHRAVCTSLPNALLIMIPRHPERAERVAKTIAAAGWNAKWRSSGDLPDVADQVYLADTLGELGLWYRVAPVAFVGGSFGQVGGHNPIEAAQLEVAILHGPDVANFREIYGQLDSAGGAEPVATAAELAAGVRRMLGTDGAGAGAKLMAAKSGAVIAQQPNAATHIARRLSGYVPTAT